MTLLCGVGFFSFFFSPSLVDLYATLSMGFEPALLQNNSCFTFTSKTINQKIRFVLGEQVVL